MRRGHEEGSSEGKECGQGKGDRVVAARGR